MKEKTSEPKPVVRIEHNGENDYTEIYVLDKGDSMAWNQSTNYDHHMSGPSLVFKRVTRNGTEISEHYVNDHDAWLWIDKMMRLGSKYLEENPDFNGWEFGDELKKERAEYKPHVSHFKNKKDK